MQAIIQNMVLIFFMYIYYAEAIAIVILFTLVNTVFHLYIYNFLSAKFNYINNISKNVKILRMEI